MTTTLQGKNIMVTGGAGGIGRAAAFVLAEAGARVVVTDVTDAGRETAEMVTGAKGEAVFIKADIGSEEQVADLVGQVVSRFGRLDGAFNNAGVEQCAVPLHELTAAQWDRAIKIDLTGVFYCLKHQIKAMLATGGGSIVNTASSLGAVAIPNASEYVAAKHGVIGITRAAAADYGPHKIRVNTVLPGIIKTPMVGRLIGDPTFSAFFDRLLARHPIGRFGEPAEIGNAVRWLLSDDASFVTGAAICVDGGYLAV